MFCQLPIPILIPKMYLLVLVTVLFMDIIFWYCILLWYIGIGVHFVVIVVSVFFIGIIFCINITLSMHCVTISVSVFFIDIIFYINIVLFMHCLAILVSVIKINRDFISAFFSVLFIIWAFLFSKLTYTKQNFLQKQKNA